jgi:hypothetical protein
MSNPYDISGQSVIFRKLLEDAPNIEADFKAFKEGYQRLLDIDHASKALILRCHLVVEYYVTQYLEAANPASPKIGDARLTFAQKLDLADHPQANFHFLMDGIRALNAIRNKIAHRLEFIPEEEDIAPILECVRTWHTAARKAIPQGLEVINVFTEIVCAFFDGDTQAIKRHGNGTGLTGLLNWWQDQKQA